MIGSDGLATRELPAWMAMWGIALMAYAGLKGMSLAAARGVPGTAIARRLAFLLLWPGMNARAFCLSHATPRPPIADWLWGIFNVATGVALAFVATGLAGERPLLAGWLGMAGIAFVLHFGLFLLLACAWRTVGVDARPLMNAPLLAASLAEFWSVRWNRAFRDWAREIVFRPVAARLGANWATAAVFLASGIVHDVVISIPAGGGLGLPTLYFGIQAAGILLERRMFAGPVGPGGAAGRRLLAIAFVVAPIGLLFHEPFVRNVIVPMFLALRRLS